MGRHSDAYDYDNGFMLAAPLPASYTPNRLFNALQEFFETQSDSHVCRELRVPKATICRLRTGKYPVPASLVIRIIDETGWALEHIRHLTGVERPGEKPYDQYGRSDGTLRQPE